GRAARRELIVEGAAAAVFLAVAIPLAIPALLSNHLDLPLTGLLVALYALVAGTVRFPVGACYLVPTYVILVPMLLLLPPAVVPLVASVAWVLASLARLAARQGRPEHVLMAVPNA